MIRKTILCVALFVASVAAAQPQHGPLTLWYDRPAAVWEETLPLGNGRLGAMPDGGVAAERIVLNDITLWSGTKQDTDNPDALKYLDDIRQMLQNGRNYEAQQLMYDRFVCKGGGSAVAEYGSYQLLGNLDLRYDVDTTAVSEYERGLKLDEAIAYTRFRAGKTRYQREYFASRYGDVVVVHLSSSRASDFTATLSRPENAEVKAEGEHIVLEGRLPSGRADVEGMAFRALLTVRTDGGRVTIEDNMLKVKGAKDAWLYLSAVTDYGGGDLRRADRLLREALDVRRSVLVENHKADHRRLFDRVSLDLGPAIDLPTDQRLKRFVKEPDPALAALYMQFGRYLMISSAREGLLPPNLQGLWANTTATPWNGDYHLNINVEMNHWITWAGNLSELQRPLIDLAHRMVPSGEHTAEVFYGTGGWCAHVLANPWCFTAPSENPSWGATNTGGAWLALHIWQQYRFTNDLEELRRNYPVMRGAAEFFLENLIREPKHNWLVTAPTSSPENGFRDAAGRPIYICMGPTMDNQILRELFGAVVQASELLGCDAELATRLRRAALQLPPNRVGEDGRLLEWLEPYEELEPEHRHVSHLFGLFPGSEITRTRTPELIEACRRTLEVRGDGGTGWSRAWKVCFWARIGDGDRAFRLLKSLLSPADPRKWQGGTYPNLFCAHPPFQIDGNFGGATGILEMLVQSHDGAVDLLPALPAAWPEGSVRGVKAAGGIEVGCSWSGGRIRQATVLSDRAQRVRLRLRDGSIREVDCPAGKPVTVVF